ncbi:MAG TPA: hypothetical protein VF812_07480 [Ktedonobacterales bacterium]
MSGFERSSSPESHDASGDSERPWPDDFTMEEEQFAEELRKVFPIEDEELPPFYIQTLLDIDVYAPVDGGDVRRMIHQVKRRVGLTRQPLFTRQWAPSAWVDQISVASVSGAVKRASRPVVAVMALLIFCMVGSMYLATPSFAQGLRLLFGNTGVQQVAHYPRNVAMEKRVTTSSTQAADMPTFWPGVSTGDYYYQGMRTLPQEQFSRGPILDIQYVLTERNNQQSGSGLLDIREFQIADSLSAVLQTVQEGSISATSVNGLDAVYVDGMWVTNQGQRTVWESGTRSMLIFERDNVIFWIVGDQRDGLGEAQLVQIASQMQPVTMKSLVQSDLLSVRLVGAQLSASLRDPIGYNDELLKLISRSTSPDTATGEFVTQGQPPQASQAPH